MTGTAELSAGTTAPPEPPALHDSDIEAAVAVLRSGQLGGPNHPAVLAFESALAGHSQVDHAVTVNSGTAALHCIIAAMGIGPGDEVVVPAHTFIATASAVLMAGATPVVVDIEPDTYCIDPAAVHDALSARTRAVVAVHINGHPAAVDKLPTETPVISDACQAHGATLFGEPVGALGVAAAFSFWQDKLITAGGEGGAVLSNDAELVERVHLMRSHGQQLIGAGPDSHHVSLGYNYRLTGVQAAIGRSQLDRLDVLVAGRRERAAVLTSLLADVPHLGTPSTRDGAEHAFWKYVVDVDTDALRDGRAGLMRALRSAGVPAAPRYPIPLTRQPVLADTSRILPCPNAERLAGRLLTLPLPADRSGLQRLADVVRDTVLDQRR
jgi:perosamine synthetase